MGFQTAGPADGVPEGEVAPFDVGGVEIAIARVDGILYAVSDVCSHRRCNLANGGELEGASIVCECHGSVFDLATGAPLNPPATEPIATYAVREIDGELQVDLG
jgi:3-phenylpropionate/trans-cinnamate dioxygenase ferredoxin subunit